MSMTYLFRIDMNRDNDAFFQARRGSDSHVYSGIAFSVGSLSDWVPDLIEVVVNESGNLTLRLIELEARKSEALISSRKYLPEDSKNVVIAFQDYLEKLIRDCRSRADSREDVFVQLKATLSEAEKIFVTSAGALRSSSELVEELPFIDQPSGIVRTKPSEEVRQVETHNFNGTLRLSGDKAAALGRAILVLDAVIRQCDHSDATFKDWRGNDRSQPLKKLLKKNGMAHSNLRAFISEKKFSGTTLDFEKIVLELVAIWSEAGSSGLNQENVRNLINRYYPIAVKINAADRMPIVFEEARKFLSELAYPCLSVVSNN